MSKHKELRVVPTDRQVIEGKLLAALDDESKVAIVASQADLELLMLGLRSPVTIGRAEARELHNALVRLGHEAFGMDPAEL